VSRPNLTTLNAALRLFAPGMRFVRAEGGRGLDVAAGRGPKAVRVRWHLRHDRLYPAGTLANRLAGGTVTRAATQLVLWWRDLPRLPIRGWEFWCGREVCLAEGKEARELLHLLQARGYGDRTACVLCGATDYLIDWWGGTTDLPAVGPCCSQGACRAKQHHRV